MKYPPFGHSAHQRLALLAAFVFGFPLFSASAVMRIAEDEASLRQVLSVSQPDDTIIVTRGFSITAPIVVATRVEISGPTIPPLGGVFIQYTGDGHLFDVRVPGVVLRGMRLLGNELCDGVKAPEGVQLSRCTLEYLRWPIVDHLVDRPWSPVRMERCLVRSCSQPVFAGQVIAVDCRFVDGRRGGVSAEMGHFLRCTFEENRDFGLVTRGSTVEQCVFRFNVGTGLLFDPDPGWLSVKSSLFYGNLGFGLYLGEEAHAVVENSTFTRHSAAPAVGVFDAHYVTFRHCTLADNNVIAGPDAFASSALTIRNSGQVSLQNSIVADNPELGDPSASGMKGTWVDLGGNLIGGDPLLGSLQDNGGEMLSLLPRPGSPAIDRGVPTPLEWDGRKLQRLGGPAPDAGATEVGAASGTQDDDSDLIPNAWEEFYGFESQMATADAEEDADGDGATNREEYIAGTNPRDPTSVLGLTMIARALTNEGSPDVVNLFWPLTHGVAYRVEWTDYLNAWRPLDGFTYISEARTPSPSLRFVASLPEATQRVYFRVVVEENVFFME